MIITNIVLEYAFSSIQWKKLFLLGRINQNNPSIGTDDDDLCFMATFVHMVG